MKKVMICTGEASGDLQGAMLVNRMRKLRPDLEFVGFGGVKMAAEGVRLLFDPSKHSCIGAWEGVKQIYALFQIYQNAKKSIRKIKPDLIVFIDSPSFNVRLARLAKTLGIPSVYYCPPSAWSGNVKRAVGISDLVDMVINIFKFTAETYDRAGVKHFYAGHHLVDVMNPWKNMPRQELLKNLGLKDDLRYVALLPGSRTAEIRYIMPILMDVARKMTQKDPDIHFLIPIATPTIKADVEKMLKGADFPVTVYHQNSAAVMAASRLVILASGSAALEASLLEKPMIITYKLNSLDYFLIKLLLKIRWVGLPNLIIQRDLIPELLQENATVENIYNWAEDLLAEGEKRQKMIEGLKDVNSTLGEPGTVERAASKILEDLL